MQAIEQMFGFLPTTWWQQQANVRETYALVFLYGRKLQVRSSPQAGTSTPVVGFPVPVSSDGTIQLPLLEPLRVAELELAQVQAEIDAQYVGKNLLKSDSPRGISVQFLLRAGEGLEIRNVAGNTSVTIPEK